jgi:hypothetical protein
MYCRQPKKHNWQVVWASVAGHGHKESHITAVTYYCTILIHLSSLLIVSELNIGTIGFQSGGSSSVPLSQAAGIKVAWVQRYKSLQFSEKQQQTSVTQPAVLQRHSSGEALKSHHLVEFQCHISWQLFQCYDSWQGLSVAAGRKFKFDLSRQGCRVVSCRFCRVVF